jgi:hypothetical protein
MDTSNFQITLRDRIIDFIGNNNPDERIYVAENDLISEGCYNESGFFNDYLPKVMNSVEKLTGLGRESIKYRLKGKIIVNRGVSFHG